MFAQSSRELQAVIGECRGCVGFKIGIQAFVRYSYKEKYRTLIHCTVEEEESPLLYIFEVEQDRMSTLSDDFSRSSTSVVSLKM